MLSRPPGQLNATHGPGHRAERERRNATTAGRGGPGTDTLSVSREGALGESPACAVEVLDGEVPPEIDPSLGCLFKRSEFDFFLKRCDFFGMMIEKKSEFDLGSAFSESARSVFSPMGYR